MADVGGERLRARSAAEVRRGRVQGAVGAYAGASEDGGEVGVVVEEGGGAGLGGGWKGNEKNQGEEERGAVHGIGHEPQLAAEWHGRQWRRDHAEDE